jgi:hypothetical protein
MFVKSEMDCSQSTGQQDKEFPRKIFWFFRL